MCFVYIRRGGENVKGSGLEHARTPTYTSAAAIQSASIKNKHTHTETIKKPNMRLQCRLPSRDASEEPDAASATSQHGQPALTAPPASAHPRTHPIIPTVMMTITIIIITTIKAHPCGGGSHAATRSSSAASSGHSLLRNNLSQSGNNKTKKGRKKNLSKKKKNPNAATQAT